jgi:hypothetical protein
VRPAAGVQSTAVRLSARQKMSADCRRHTPCAARRPRGSECSLSSELRHTECGCYITGSYGTRSVPATFPSRGSFRRRIR